MDRLVFHVDVNSAFLSWEASKRVREGKEDIRLIPSAVGGDREKRSGVILAKSIPAKKYGVKTGEPVAMALRKCPTLYLARPDFKLYENCSRAFTEICKSYAPVIEKFSIDECFLDMSGTGRIYPDPVKTANEIKDKIRDRLGFTVNIGIGTNKLLAKMASDFEKPDKVHTLFPHEIEKKMWPLPVRDLFSVGASTAEKLENSGIRTIGELAKCELGAIQVLVGMKLGAQIHAYANGIDDSPVVGESEEAKGYSNSTTLEKDVTRAEDAYKILLALSDSVASRMRNDNGETFCIGVTIRGNDFKDRSHQRKLNESTNITSEIYRTAKTLFDELWDGRMPIRLIGVALSSITREPSEQMTLFFDEERERSRKVDSVVDSIRKRFGSGTIMPAASAEASLKVGRKHKAQLDITEENKK
ncbi:MAG: DNA polymerase IV [Clostridia bacterium]|nr:DNA polymerase IV [Clostridia bacterium]